MAAPFSNTQLRVPPGFQNILESLSREVLRSQPENIYQFATEYFAGLLKRREETGEDDIALLGAHLEDRYYNNKAFSQTNVNSHDPHQQEAAVKIQSEYRRHAAQKEMHSRREEQAVTTIQASFRGYQDRLRVMEMKKEMESARSAHHAQAEGGTGGRDESDTEDDEKRKTVEMDEAATKIQAAFKGYVTRRDQADAHGKKSPERSEGHGTPPVRPQSGRHSGRSFGHRDEEDEERRELEMEDESGREKLLAEDEDEMRENYRGGDFEEAAASEDGEQHSEKDEAEEHSAGEESAPASSRHSKASSRHSKPSVRDADEAPAEEAPVGEDMGDDAPAEEPAEQEEEEEPTVLIPTPPAYPRPPPIMSPTATGDDLEPDMEKAAVKIQATFRGQRVRRHQSRVAEAPADSAHLRHEEADDNENNSEGGGDDMELGTGGADPLFQEQPEDASEMQETSRTMDDSFREKTPSPAPAEEGEEDATEQETSARPAEEDEEPGEQAEEVNEEEAE